MRSAYSKTMSQAMLSAIALLLTAITSYLGAGFEYVYTEIRVIGNYVYISIFAFSRRVAVSGQQVAGAFVGGIIGLFVAVEVAIALFPSVATGVNSLTSGASAPLQGTSATLVGQIILFLALALLLVAVAFAVQYVRHIRT